MHAKIWNSALAGLVVLIVTTPATAGFVAFTNRSAFEAATVSRRTIDFEGLALPNDLMTASHLTLQGVTFTGVTLGDSSLYVVEPGLFPDLYEWNSGAVLVGPSAEGAVARIDVVLPAGVTAIGTDLMTLAAGLPVLVTLDDGTTFNVATAEFPNRTFFGLVADAPISEVSFIVDGAAPLLDNFAFVQPVPLPPSIVLLGIGFAMLAAPLRARVRRMQVAAEKD